MKKNQNFKQLNAEEMKKVKGGHLTTAGFKYLCHDGNINTSFIICSQTDPVMVDCNEDSYCLKKVACDPAVAGYMYTCG